MTLIQCTVPTFNSCTKCSGSPGILHDRTPDCHTFSRYGCIDDIITERSFDSQTTWTIVLGFTIDMSSLGV